MEPATRQLIYVSRDPSAELHTRFHQRGWHVEVVGSARDVRRAVRAGMAAGGLLDLSSDFQPHEIAAFESCLTMPNLAWTIAGRGLAPARAGLLFRLCNGAVLGRQDRGFGRSCIRHDFARRAGI